MQSTEAYLNRVSHRNEACTCEGVVLAVPTAIRCPPIGPQLAPAWPKLGHNSVPSSTHPAPARFFSQAQAAQTRPQACTNSISSLPFAWPRLCPNRFQVFPTQAQFVFRPGTGCPNSARTLPKLGPAFFTPSPRYVFMSGAGPPKQAPTLPQLSPKYAPSLPQLGPACPNSAPSLPQSA
jgi:hypothetical protein